MNLKAPKFTTIIIALLIAFFLFRAGQVLPAGIVALLIALSPFINQLAAKVIKKEDADDLQSGPMSRSEALEILGLAENPSKEQINEAYHRLILKNHPDQGGSSYLAARINEARKVLIGE